MTPEKYLDLKQAIIDAGYEHDIQWAEPDGSIEILDINLKE